MAFNSLPYGFIFFRYNQKFMFATLICQEHNIDAATSVLSDEEYLAIHEFGGFSDVLSFCR